MINAKLRKPLNISQHAVLGLEIGSQLRNADLVRDCVCYLSGRWDIDPDLSFFDPKLRALVTKARQGVLATIGTAHNNVMTATLRNTSARLLLNRMYEDIPAHNTLPQYYYEVHKLNVGIYIFTPYFGDVSSLMVNNLRLVRDSVSPEQGSHSHYFLCGEVSDEDLPWDTTQLDW